MKILVKVLFVAICASLLFSCAKEEALLENQDEMTLKKASMAPTFVVEPTGIDDTENLKNAFADAMAAGDGSIVKLVEGEYFIDLIEVFEFHGTLKGAGKGKTIITHIESVNYEDEDASLGFYVLLKFVGGDVCVKDLSFYTQEGNTNWFSGLVGFFGFSPVYEVENEYINAKVDNIEIVGNQNDVGYGLITGSDSRWMEEGVPFCKIDISVTNSYFANCKWYGACIMMISEGKVTVGTKNGGNTFVPRSIWSYGNLGLWHFVNTKMSVVGNHFQGTNGRCGGLDILSAPYLAHHAHSPQDFASVANVEHNTFDVENFKSAAIIIDNRRQFYPEEEPMKVQFKSNRLITSGGTSALRCFQLSGAVIRNNKFCGTSPNGITIGGVSSGVFNVLPPGTEVVTPEVYSDNGLMLGNNFSTATYSSETVFLNEYTSDWTIVGGHIGQDVSDMGENNLVNGMNWNMTEVPPGQTIVDNLQEMKRPMHDLK